MCSSVLRYQIVLGSGPEFQRTDYLLVEGGTIIPLSECIQRAPVLVDARPHFHISVSESSQLQLLHVRKQENEVAVPQLTL
jgi:hypothetical protein